MLGTQQLRMLMQERLTAAVEEIFVLVEKTISEYQDEVVQSKREVVLLKQEIQQLSTLQPRVQLCRIDSQPVSEELNPWQEMMSSQDDTVVQQPSQVKEERVDISIIPDSVTSISNSVTHGFVNSETNSDSAVFPVTSISNSVTHGFVNSETNSDSAVFPPYTSITVATNHDAVANKNNECEEQSSMILDGDVLCKRICRFCQKQFCTHQDLVKHVKMSHREQKPYECTKCGREFARRDQWTAHYHSHTALGPHSCAVCGKLFPQRQGLIVHMKIHPGFKPHACPVCGKLFALVSSLNVHMEVHKVFKSSCPTCGKGFATEVALKHHIRRMHFCKNCGKMVTHSSNHLKGCET